MDIKIIFVAMAMVAMTHCEDCNKHLSGMSGTIKTGKYEDGLNCTWTITAPEDHSIRLEFIQFDVLSRFLNCDHDYVEVSFVRDPRPHMATFCNSFRKDHLPTGPMQSTTNVLVIRLISDKFYKNGDGFEARYVVLDKYNEPVVSEDSDDEDEDGGWDDDSTGRDVGEKSEWPKDSIVNTIEKKNTDDKKVVAASTSKSEENKKKKNRKGKKGRGKKSKKSKEEKKRERKLRRQKEKALKRKARKANRRRKSKAKAKKA